MADQEVELVEFPVEVEVDLKIDARDIERNLSPKQVLQLITQLDDEVGLWALTIMLHRYFESQYELAKAKSPELAFCSDEELMKELEESEDDEGEPNTPVMS